MQKTNRWQRLIIVLCLVLPMAACGQKGELYLPEGKAITSWLG